MTQDHTPRQGPTVSSPIAGPGVVSAARAPLTLGVLEDPAVLVALTHPIDVIDPATPCAVVDEAFRADPDLVCLAVRPRLQDADASWGLVSRGPFMSAMAGRLGYGRSVHARHPVAALTDWDALVLSPDTRIAEAARLIRERPRQARYSEALVLTPSKHTAPLHPDQPDQQHDPYDQLSGGALQRIPGPRSSPPAQDTPLHIAYLEVEDVLGALAAELTHKAQTDALTQLANREHFLAQLHQAAAAATRDVRQLVVAYVDVDDFKKMNDGYGHATGDRVLQEVAQRLRHAVRPDDLIARLGGDEFAVLLHPPVTLVGSAEQVLGWAHQVAQRLLEHLLTPIRLAGRSLPGQVSIGLAVSEPGVVDPTVVLHEADLAMYRAKAAGGSRCAVTDTTTAASFVLAQAPDRIELQRAVDAGQFIVHFQPILEATSGVLVSTEALVRWAHPTRGLLPPGAFLADVEAAGFISTLDVHVLRSALAQQARWLSEHGPLAPAHLNVNLSVPSLLRGDLAEVVLAELAAAEIAPQVLRLEVPEVATAAHLVSAAPALLALRAAGVGVCLDDVGTGAAGLAHLRDVHLDGIKIDRSYIKGMLTDERDAAVVRVLADMGHALALRVTVEGVETPAHLAALVELARERPERELCVQGFAISRPVPAAELAGRWMAALDPVDPRHARP